MGKQWVRAQIRRDEVQTAVGSAIHWVAENRQIAGIIAGVTAGVLLLGSLFLYSSHIKQTTAWNAYSMANGYAYLGQPDMAIQKVEELNTQYPSTAASGHALLFAGDLLYSKGQFPQSTKFYEQLLDKGQPEKLLPFALAGLTAAQEAQNLCPEAIRTVERFLATYPDHFLAPQVHAGLARCQATMGQVDASKATLQKIALQYPETAWAAWAQERLKALGGGV